MIDWSKELTKLFDDYMSPKFNQKWHIIKKEYSEGDCITGTVVARVPFGVWLDVSLGFPALLEIIYMDGMNHEVHKEDKYFTIGSQVEAKIIGFVDSRHQIYLKDKNYKK